MIPHREDARSTSEHEPRATSGTVTSTPHRSGAPHADRLSGRDRSRSGRFPLPEGEEVDVAEGCE